jgi:hypothetical protein
VDEVNPLLGRSFFEDPNKLLVGSRTRRLSSMGFEFERNEFQLALLLCGERLLDKWQHRLGSGKGLRLPPWGEVFFLIGNRIFLQ